MSLLLFDLLVFLPRVAGDIWIVVGGLHLVKQQIYAELKGDSYLLPSWGSMGRENLGSC